MLTGVEPDGVMGEPPAAVQAGERGLMLFPGRYISFFVLVIAGIGLSGCKVEQAIERKDGAPPSHDSRGPDVAGSPDHGRPPDLSRVDGPAVATDGPQAGPDAATGGDAGKALLSIVDVTFPHFFSGNRFPTSLSHLYGSTALKPSRAFARVRVLNAGTSPAYSVQVELKFAAYSTTTTSTIYCPPGKTTTVDLTPSFLLSKLFALTSNVNEWVVTTVKHAGKTVDTDNRLITVASRGAFDTSKLNPWSSVFVTPKDKLGAISQLTLQAGAKMPGKSWPGYQKMYARPWSKTVAVSDHEDDATYLLKGHQICISITGITTTDSNKEIDLLVQDDANYLLFSYGKPATNLTAYLGAKAGASLCFKAAAHGWHHMVYYNPSKNTASRSVTRQRDASHFDIVYYHGESLFESLKSNSVTLTNAPAGNFWNSVNDLRYPSDTLKAKGGTCLDGAFLFASAFEAAGLRPLLVLVPGHALVGVRIWSNEDIIIPLETTLVGKSTFKAAYNSGAQQYNKYFYQGKVTLVDIEQARKNGVTPAPL